MYCSKDFQTRMMSRLPRESLKKNILFLFELSPSSNLELENCNQDILKTVIARSFKLGQLIEGDKYIDCLVKIKTSYLFFRFISLCRFGLQKFIIVISQKVL